MPPFRSKTKNEVFNHLLSINEGRRFDLDQSHLQTKKKKMFLSRIAVQLYACLAFFVQLELVR